MKITFLGFLVILGAVILGLGLLTAGQKKPPDDLPRRNTWL